MSRVPGPPPTAVRAVAWDRLDVELRAPFGISRGAQAVANNVLVTVELADGTIGLGEGAPLPAYNGETQEVVLAALDKSRGRLVGWDAARWRECRGLFATPGDKIPGSALCALETALLDACLRREGRTFSDYFGGRGSSVETDMTVTTGSAEDARTAAQDIIRRGIRTIKVKVGGPPGVAADLRRIAAIREVAPEAPLILDGNAGLDRIEAADLAAGLRRLGIRPRLLEQWLPKDDLPGMASLGRETGWTVAADEAAVAASDVLRIAAAGAAQVINIKLMKAGIAGAEETLSAARASGLRLMIGANVETLLGTTVAAAFAAGNGGFEFADLDTPLFMAANPFRGGAVYRGFVLTLEGIDAGHGVRRAAAF